MVLVILAPSKGNLNKIINKMVKNCEGIRVYEDLFKDHVLINAWKWKECFQIEGISDFEKERASSLAVVEILYKGAYGKRYIVDKKRNIDWFDYTYDVFYSDIVEMLQGLQLNLYALKTDAPPQLKNRIRSYKGIVPKHLNNSNAFIQKEIQTSENYSLFAAIVKLNDLKKEEMKNIIDTFSSCLIATPSTIVFSERFLDDVPTKYMNADCDFDYMKLIVDLCPSGDFVCRIGGDGGDKEITFQMFCEKRKKDDLVAYLNCLP